MGVVELRYAQALYEAARARDRVEEVRAALAEIVQAQEEVPELKAVLLNPELDSASKAELIDSLMAGEQPLFRNFVRLLAEKDRLSTLAGVRGEFEALVAMGERRLQVTLTTARELSSEEERSLVERIEAGVGRAIEARHKVDPDLLGGLLVEAGSRRFDGSVRGRIERLRKELVQ